MSRTVQKPLTSQEIKNLVEARHFENAKYLALPKGEYFKTSLAQQKTALLRNNNLLDVLVHYLEHVFSLSPLQNTQVEYATYSKDTYVRFGYEMGPRGKYLLGESLTTYLPHYLPAPLVHCIVENAVFDEDRTYSHFIDVRKLKDALRTWLSEIDPESLSEFNRVALTGLHHQLQSSQKPPVSVPVDLENAQKSEIDEGIVRTRSLIAQIRRRRMAVTPGEAPQEERIESQTG